MPAYQAGDQGILRSGPKQSSDGTLRYYHVAMDKDGPAHPMVIFTEGEIEPDM